MVGMRTAKAIPNARAIGTAVGDVEPTSATQQAGEQPVPAANSAARQQTVPGGVVGDHALVPFILRPGT